MKKIIIYLIVLMYAFTSYSYNKTTADEGISLIKSFEGCYIKAYKCPAGVWTIGWGNTSHARPGLIITKDIAVQYLREDLKRFEKHVNGNSKRDLLNNQFDALVSFTFNVGRRFTGNLARHVNNNNTIEACNTLLLYNKARVNGELKVLRGLTRRRVAETILYKKV